ncbi:hypothetical protein [Amycolatopsis anabasis]|uniref:hypothetical protein n=1 Tax=Amycolatopsis anabasis TaxID=1840409 RepID=UPI00131E47D0|nr:hypothetical protein [Amycolatopsis anabasis]
MPGGPGWKGGGSAGDLTEGGEAEVDGGGAAGAFLQLGEFVVRVGQADVRAFGFTEPAFAFGFLDSGGEVVADLDQLGFLLRVNA